jgi:RHS repeat-associated protein
MEFTGSQRVINTADGQIATLTLVNDETGNQVTRWVYGTTLADSGVARKDLLRAKIYPMSDDSHAPIGNGWDGTYQRTEYGYNRQGNLVTKKDPNETVHEYAYDGLGRQIEDAVTAFGTGIDEAVKRITTTYEARGMVATVTSHDALSGGSVLNEVAYAYDDFGQLSEDAQAHGGEVDGSTPRVLYGYADGSTDNTARRLSMTYPDGRVIDYLYGDTESLDNHLSRIGALKVNGESQDLVTYSYVGEARYVKIAYPEPGIELSYIKNSGEPERDSGDPYTGYDRFGRTVDMKWQTPDGATMLDRVQYGYDRSSSRTWRRDLAAPAGHDEFFRYDALHQVTDLSRGNLNLNQTAIGGIPVFEENFEYDPTGNWNRYRSATDGAETLDQTRVNNRDNQITQLDGSNEGILYDRAGQARQMPPDVDGDWSQYYRLVWDAWGRLVQVKDGSLATVASYAYDGTTRRITKTVGGTTIHTYYNDRWKAIEEREGSSTDASRQYLWGARPNHRDELVRSERDTTGGGTLDERLYCVMDYYDPIAMTDASGEVVERYEFSAFGLRTVMDAAWGPLTDSAHIVEFAFHGQFLDTETGYYNYGYRYYSPQIGRWLSKDPIEELGGVNLYVFVRNRAVNANDFVGLSDEEKTLKIAFKGANPSDLPLIPDFPNWVDGYEYFSLYEGVEIFNSLQGDDAIKRVREKVDEVGCIDLRIAGFSWGAWTALKVSHKLSDDEEIGEKVTIRLGLIDPVPKLRGEKWGSKASRVVFLVNYYQTNGLLKRNGEYIEAFKGVPVSGADFQLDTVSVFPDIEHLSILTWYAHPVLQQTYSP